MALEKLNAILEKHFLRIKSLRLNLKEFSVIKRQEDFLWQRFLNTPNS